MKTRLVVAQDIDGLSRKAARLFHKIYSEEVKRKGYFTAVLSGGRTPLTAYRDILEQCGKGIDWEKVYLFWGDERCVSPDSTESNYRLAHEALISKVDIPQKNVFRIQGELEPRLAASSYENAIKDFFSGKGEGGSLSFDLVFLGLGVDGHTLSLFPGSAAIREAKRLVIENHAQGRGWRVTMTPKLVNRAKNIAFLVAGEEKAEVLKEVLGKKGGLPANLIKPENGALMWMADKKAAKWIQG